jgi:hypothetical protein
MLHFSKVVLVTSVLGLAMIGPALAGETYFIIKSEKGEFAVTQDVVAKLKQTEFKSELSDLDEETHVVKGPLLRDLIAASGATGQTITAIAADEYKADIPVSDTTSYDVIVAVSMDGKPLTVDENGPARILYPVLDNPKLKDDEAVAARAVFQLKELDVK